MCRSYLGAIFFLTLGFWSYAGAKPKRSGLIYDTGGRGDLSFCDASYAGAKKAAEQWKIELKEITPGQSADIERALRQLARLEIRSYYRRRLSVSSSHDPSGSGLPRNQLCNSSM